MSGTYNVGVYVEDSLIQSFNFEVEISDENGTECNEIIDWGCYEITIITDSNTDTTKSATVYVKREIVILVKECEYDLDSGDVVFDPTMILMEADKAIMPGHTLEDVYISVNTNNGEIVVTGIKVVDKNGNDASHYICSPLSRGLLRITNNKCRQKNIERHN